MKKTTETQVTYKDLGWTFAAFFEPVMATVAAWVKAKRVTRNGKPWIAFQQFTENGGYKSTDGAVVSHAKQEQVAADLLGVDQEFLHALWAEHAEMWNAGKPPSSPSPKLMAKLEAELGPLNPKPKPKDPPKPAGNDTPPPPVAAPSSKTPWVIGALFLLGAGGLVWYATSDA